MSFRLSTTWNSDLTEKAKREFFQGVAVSVLLYVCTSSVQTKCLEKRFDGNYIWKMRLF